MLPAKDVLIVGGGRWARTVASAALDVADARIGMASPRNSGGLAAWRDSLGERGRRVTVWESLDEALADRHWSAAIAANLPSEHAAIARRLVACAIPTLVEKPLTPTFAESAELVDEAERLHVLLAVGHEFLFDARVAAYVARARSAESLEIVAEWHENPSVHRDGSVRVPDLTTSAIGDYFPHLLTITSAWADLAGAEVRSVRLEPSGAIAIDVALRRGRLQASLSRCGGPRRVVRARTPSDAWEIDLIATPAPAADADSAADPIARRYAGQPLQRELAQFLAALDDDEPPLANPARAALELVRLTERCEALLADERLRLFRELARAADGTPPCAALVDAAREAIVVTLSDARVIDSVKDHAGASRWAAAAIATLVRLANDPFVTAAELARRIGATPAEYAVLSSALAAWPLAQTAITAGGHGRKYWTNTIVPLLRSGAVTDAFAQRPRFPFRIGLYPGLSCMFHCSFCGRVPDARFAPASARGGRDHFVALYDAAPKDDPYRFYLSGGLEPLTHPAIGDVVREGAARGFKLSIYTNALMLTPAFLQKQAGLWELDVLRVSLYGTDRASAFATSKHPRSFDQVIANVVAFLRLREQNGSAVRIGFNHVLLPGQTGAVDVLGDLLAQVRRDAGTARGVDFLTLREDYSTPSDPGIAAEERARMGRGLRRLRERTTAGGDLAPLSVDLGYALEPLLDDAPAEQLRFATLEELRPGIYPQVSVVIDVLGDVYAYREAAFPERAGADRYILGRLGRDGTLDEIVARWVEDGRTVEARPGDLGLLDSFDHVVTRLLATADADRRAGLPPRLGPVQAWRSLTESERALLAAPVLAHPTLPTR